MACSSLLVLFFSPLNLLHACQFGPLVRPQLTSFSGRLHSLRPFWVGDRLLVAHWVKLFYDTGPRGGGTGQGGGSSAGGVGPRGAVTKRRPLLSISAANASLLLSGERGDPGPGEEEQKEEKEETEEGEEETEEEKAVGTAGDDDGRVQRRALLQAGAHQRLHQQRQQRRQRRTSSRLRNQRLLVPPLVSEDPPLHPPPLPPLLDPKSELRRRLQRGTTAPEDSQRMLGLYVHSDAFADENGEDEKEEEEGEVGEEEEAMSLVSGRVLSQQRPQKNWRVKPQTAQQRQQALIGALATSHQAQTAAIARQAALGAMHQRRADRAELFAQLGGASRGLRGHAQEREGRRRLGEEDEGLGPEEGGGGIRRKGGRVLVAAGEEGLDPEALRARLARGRRRDPGGTGAVQQRRRRDTGSIGLLRAAAATVAASMEASSSLPGAADENAAPRHPHFPRHPAAGRECLFLAGHSCEFSVVSVVDLEAGTLSLVRAPSCPCHSSPPCHHPCDPCPPVITHVTHAPSVMMSSLGTHVIHAPISPPM